MDKFVLKTPNSKVSKNPHLPVNINAKDRARQYPYGIFHVDNGLMFCSSCNVVVDHLRKFVIERHLESTSHKKYIDVKGSSHQPKQQTIKTTFECNTKAKAAKIKVCHDIIKVFTSANIPLHKIDNPVMRKFLKTNVSNGGAIPKSSQLRDYYLFDLYEVERVQLKDMIQDKKVALIADELCDSEGRYVLDVMAVCLGFNELSPNGNCIAYLLDSHYLSRTNNKTVSQAIMKSVCDYGIDFDNVYIFNSDNVSYMTKAYNDTPSTLFPNCVHITCHSHIVNLAASDFKKSYQEATEFMKCVRNLFFKPSGRKGRFRKFLQDALGTESNIRMPPNPTTKSWDAWFNSAIYHAEYYHLFGPFIEDELKQAGSQASASLHRLNETYNEDDFMRRLHAQLKAIKSKAPTLLQYLKQFQQHIPQITGAYDQMQRLLHYLDENCDLKEKDISFCFLEGTNTNEREELAEVVNSSFKDAYNKLHKYVCDGGQPGSEFLDQIRALDPRALIDLPFEIDHFCDIPGIERVSKEEWNLYRNHIGPNAVTQSRDGSIDLTLFWKSKADLLPELYSLASSYCTGTISSCEVERAFSAYNDVLSPHRRSLDQATMSAFHFLNWNYRMLTKIEEEKGRKRRTPLSRREKDQGQS
jgi:hypothetical protein